MMSALPSAAAHLDYDQPRLGSGIPYSVPRGTYQCADGHWVAVSTSAESVAHRVLELARRRRRPALRRRSRAAPSTARSSTRSSRAWIGARPSAEVLAAFEAAQAAIAPVYTMRELLADPHVRRPRRVRRGRRRRDAGPTARLVADAGDDPPRGPPARAPTRTRPGRAPSLRPRTAIVPRRAGRETAPTISSGRVAGSLPRFSPGFPPGLWKTALAAQ